MVYKNTYYEITTTNEKLFSQKVQIFVKVSKTKIICDKTPKKC